MFESIYNFVQDIEYALPLILSMSAGAIVATATIKIYNWVVEPIYRPPVEEVIPEEDMTSLFEKINEIRKSPAERNALGIHGYAIMNKIIPPSLTDGEYSKLKRYLMRVAHEKHPADVIHLLHEKGITLIHNDYRSINLNTLDVYYTLKDGLIDDFVRCGKYEYPMRIDKFINSLAGKELNTLDENIFFDEDAKLEIEDMNGNSLRTIGKGKNLIKIRAILDEDTNNIIEFTALDSSTISH